MWGDVYQAISFTPSTLGVLMVSLIITVYFIPAKITKPSNLFTLIYGLLIIVPYCVMYQIAGYIDIVEYSLRFLILVIPLIVVNSIGTFHIAIKLPYINEDKYIVNSIIGLCFIVLFVLFVNAPPSAGFSLEDSYNRRFEARDIFGSGTFISYASDMVINSFVPFLAYYAFYKKKYLILYLSIMICLFFFYVAGLKAPFAYVFLALVFVKLVVENKLNLFFMYIVIIIVTLVIVSSVEFMFFDYSFISDYIIRRSFAVPAYLTSSYFNFANAESSFNIINGLGSVGVVSYLVGEVFLNTPGLNANVNAFVSAFVSGGFLGYIEILLLVTFLYSYIDSAYKDKGRLEFFFVSLMFSILLTEQVATTALVSSGIGPLLLLTSFLRKEIGNTSSRLVI
jgi:hypothetical protein